ncbi:hypothetical protein AX16_007754 [Volvariella volvacea WC 439]|nr:hypothetical protein AX16_007754 [Volvariella volvacea WC 439]
MAALWTSDASLNVDPTSLPPLTRVGGTHATLTSLLPVCPTITEVYWTTAFGEGSVAHPRVLASLKQLRKLAFEWFAARGLINFSTVAISKEKNDPLLEEVIGKIPKLRWVLVHSHYNHTWDRTYDELASAIFRSNTSLRYISIEIPEQSNFTQYAYYHYYKRDSTAKSLVKFLGVAGAQRWFWGFNEKRYLEEGWEGF